MASSFKIDGREYEVPEEFTLGEMCDMEQHFGVRFGEETGVRMVAAMLYVAIRRVDATVTIDDIRSLSPEVLGELSAEVAPDDPPEEALVSSATSGGGSAAL